MNKRPKIGLFFLAGESWWNAGLSDAKDGPYVGFIKKIKDDVDSITKELEKDFDLV